MIAPESKHMRRHAQGYRLFERGLASGELGGGSASLDRRVRSRGAGAVGRAPSEDTAEVS